MKFRKPETPEEIEQERQAKQDVINMLTGGMFSRDETEGRWSREVRLQTYGNLLAIAVVCILFLTGVIGTSLYILSIMTSFAFAIVLSVAALYFARQDVKNLR